jgi:hypothetical protein
MGSAGVSLTSYSIPSTARDVYSYSPCLLEGSFAVTECVPLHFEYIFADIDHGVKTGCPIEQNAQPLSSAGLAMSDFHAEHFLGRLRNFPIPPLRSARCLSCDQAPRSCESPLRGPHFSFLAVDFLSSLRIPCFWPDSQIAERHPQVRKFASLVSSFVTQFAFLCIPLPVVFYALASCPFHPLSSLHSLVCFFCSCQAFKFLTWRAVAPVQTTPPFPVDSSGRFSTFSP